MTAAGPLPNIITALKLSPAFRSSGLRRTGVRESGGVIRHVGSDRPRGGTEARPELDGIAGYRVVRTISAGERATIYLGHSDHGSHDRVVAIKVFHPGTDSASIEREITALANCRAGCLPQLIDVASLPGGSVALMLERLGGGTVGSLLHRRGTVQPGEVVTILAPISVALAALHTAGFAHTTLSQGTVTLDATGRPVITGLGGLRELPPHTRAGVGRDGRSRNDLVRDDYARLTILMRGVFAHLDGGTLAARQSEYLAAWFEGAISAVPFLPRLDELERRLFEWAPASPIAQAASDPAARNSPSRVGSSPPPDDTDARARDGLSAPATAATETTAARELPPPRARRLRQWLGVLHLPDDLAVTLLRAVDGSPLAEHGRRLRTRLHGRRRMVLVAGSIAVATTAIALTFLPQSAEPTAPSGYPRPESDGVEPFGGGVDSDPGARAAVLGDDPVAAVPHLLAARSACLAADVLACLADVDQPDSPLLAADRHSHADRAAGGPEPAPRDYRALTPTLIERSGDWALIALSAVAHAANDEPASLLVVKGEAGWRLREIFETGEVLE